MIIEAIKITIVKQKVSYSCDLSNRLTRIDESKPYDAIGNLLGYSSWNLTWEEGRQLSGMSGNGNTISYKYNDSGIRTSKTVNGVTTKYNLVGDKVTYENNGTDKIYYTYDSSDNLVSMSLSRADSYRQILLYQECTR